LRLIRLMNVAAFALAAACGSSTSPSGPGPSQVFMQGIAFSPTTRTVSVGATVTWLNQDAVAHTVTYSSGPGTSFSSGTIAPAGIYTHTFTVSGTYQYYCTIHGTPTTGMRGTIVVQ
jgi:plastocyanin